LRKNVEVQKRLGGEWELSIEDVVNVVVRFSPAALKVTLAREMCV
jgi:hypothetical protein